MEKETKIKLSRGTTFLALATLGLASISGCAEQNIPSVCQQFSGTGDYQVCLKDPDTYQRHADAYVSNMEKSDEHLQTAKPFDAYCEEIHEGDSVSVVAMAANGGELPPIDWRVEIDPINSEENQSMTWEEAARSNPIVQTGDEVCVWDRK